MNYKCKTDELDRVIQAALNLFPILNTSFVILK